MQAVNALHRVEQSIKDGMPEDFFTIDLMEAYQQLGLINGDTATEDLVNKVAYEAYRVLKKGKMCAVMIGDIRKCGKVVPLGFRMMECFLRAGFINKEIIIKEQHNCKSTGYWEKQNNNFLLLAHEYIFVFEK